MNTGCHISVCQGVLTPHPRRFAHVCYIPTGNRPGGAVGWGMLGVGMLGVEGNAWPMGFVHFIPCDIWLQNI